MKIGFRIQVSDWVESLEKCPLRNFRSWFQTPISGLVFLVLAWGAQAAPSPFVVERLKDSVNWRPWSKETLREFRESGKPGLLTISHELNELSFAMGKESFRNDDIALKINEGFFPLAFDKNELPQLAAFFSAYVRNSKQFTGWPLTVLVTPNFLPIEGGGYYPPTDDWGSQGLSSLVAKVEEQWSSRSETVLEKAREALDLLESYYGLSSKTSVSLESNANGLLVENLGFRYDSEFGGFSLPPKAVTFDPLRSIDLAISLGDDEDERLVNMRRKTLDALSMSAVRDYIRGGFFTASTDASWSIPDFGKEAVVQVNAICYLSKYPEFEGIVRDTADGLVSDFRNEYGLYSEKIRFGSTSAEDIEVNTWEYEELESILTEGERNAFMKEYGAKREGNVPDEFDVTGDFKSRNILIKSSRERDGNLVTSAREKLKHSSRSRFSVVRESISSVETNAIVAIGLINAGDNFKHVARELVQRAIEVFWDQKDGRILAASIEGYALEVEASSKGYALFISMLLDGYVAYGESSYLGLARNVQRELDARFSSELGPYWIASADNEYVPANLYAFFEDGFGSANSISCANLARLHAEFPNDGYGKKRAAILDNLPEEVLYASELYIDLILAGISWGGH